MRAAIVAVGSELLGPTRLDTNSLGLARRLESHGVRLIGKSVVGDDEAAIAAELRRWMGSCDLIVVSGGLGPTADDRTRTGLAAATGRELRRDPAVLHDLERKYRRLGRPMPAVNVRQADVVEGARVLPNPRGTAPGLCLEVEGCAVFLLPGPPHELEGLAQDELEPWLDRAAGPVRQDAARVVRVACTPEARVEELLAPYYEVYGDREVTVLAGPGEVEVHVRPDEPERADLTERVSLLRECLGSAVYSETAHDSLEAYVGRLLVERGQTVATAESCTGGLVAERLTRVPGSSRYFLGAVVAYANEIKHRGMGVDTELIERHGSVSAEVAEAMAVGVRSRYGADWVVSLTGIAGPGGGTPDKPVGTVFLGIAGGGSSSSQGTTFPGDRGHIRALSSQAALDLLRRELES